MRFCCPLCHFSISTDLSLLGSRTICPGCGKNILVPSSRFEEGCIIGDFIINSHLGRGAIGDVYKATQISLDRTVALKILTQKFINKKGISDFLKEARAAATLSHINLVQSYAVGTDDDCIYMAMTYIKGETLRSRLKREGRIPVDEALHIVQQVAEALYYAWDECRIIHRDVKPDNIMLTENGVVKLTDLGLAMSQSEWSEGMEISGSPSYMSPEQFAGEKLDTRSDIYSLGITLYQMIAGVLPFDAETVTSVAQQHFNQEAVPLNRILPDVPSNVVRLVKKMIAKNIEDRHANMEELLHNIWTIRQNTAPNRDMVPDVHTISSKFLDYEIQNEQILRPDPAIRKKNAVPFATVKKQSTRSWRKILIFRVLPGFLLLVLLLFLFLHYQTRSRIREAEHDLSAFEALAADPGVSQIILEGEAESLLTKHHKIFRTESCFRFAPDRIRYLLMKRQIHSSSTSGRNESSGKP